jgi:hypothetical protein
MKELKLEKQERPKEIEFFIKVTYDSDTGYPHPYLCVMKPSEEAVLEDVFLIKIPVKPIKTY